MPISWFAVLRTMLEGLNSLVDQEQTHSTGNSGGGAGGSQHQQGSRKRSSLLETIKNRIVRRASNGTKEDSIAEEKPILPLQISVELFPEEKGMFEHSMKRATLGKQDAKETNEVPQWAIDQESISRDLITSSAKVEPSVA